MAATTLHKIQAPSGANSSFEQGQQRHRVSLPVLDRGEPELERAADIEVSVAEIDVKANPYSEKAVAAHMIGADRPVDEILEYIVRRDTHDTVGSGHLAGLVAQRVSREIDRALNNIDWRIESEQTYISALLPHTGLSDQQRQELIVRAIQTHIGEKGQHGQAALKIAMGDCDRLEGTVLRPYLESVRAAFQQRYAEA